MAEPKKTAAKKTAAPKAPKANEGAAPSKDSALRQAYGAATSRLRENHREDFNALMRDETTQRGISWEPKKTQEQKDAEAFDALLAEHPEFAGRINATVVDPALSGGDAPVEESGDTV